MYRLLSAGSFAAAFAIMLFSIYPPQALEDRIALWWGFWLFPWVMASGGLIWAGAWALKRPIPAGTLLVGTDRYDRGWWLGMAATVVPVSLALLSLDEFLPASARGQFTTTSFVVFWSLAMQHVWHPNARFDSAGIRIRRDVIRWSAVAAYRFDQPGHVLKMLVTWDRLPVADPAIGQAGFRLVTIPAPGGGGSRARSLQQLLAEHLPGRRVGEPELPLEVIGAHRTATSGR